MALEDGHASVSLGGYLRALRLAAGASLPDMARATRISERHLLALESDGLSELPAPVFVKGFIRAYCAFLGAPPDEALALYGGTPPVTCAVPARTVSREAGTSWIGHPLAVSVVLLIIFGAGVVALNLATRARGVATPAPVLPAAVREAAPVVPAAPESVAPAAPGPGPAIPVVGRTETSPSQRLVVKAVEATWIRVQPDEGSAVEELLAPGVTREWTADKRFLLTIGNAGGIEVELNGRTLPSLGARGAVIHRLSLPERPTAGS